MQRWVDFFEPHFPSRADAEAFVAPLSALVPTDARHPAKIMMHQTRRLVSIADDLPTVRPSRDALPLLFLLICAENIAKMCDRFHQEGKSRHYVRLFFERHLMPQDKALLRSGITNHARQSLTLQAVVDALYDVRCDVVHEGRYWGLTFRDAGTPMLNLDPDVVISILRLPLKNVVLSRVIL